MPFVSARSRRRALRSDSTRPSHELARMGGWSPGTGTLAQAEALAGINPQDPAERATLWKRFSHWSAAGHAQMAVDAVVDHCARITMERVRRGELSLLDPYRPTGTRRTTSPPAGEAQ